MEELDAAVEVLRKDISIEPDLGYHYDKLGRGSLPQSRGEEAEKACLQALKHEPRLPIVLMELAKMHLRKGDLQTASREAGTAVKLEPNNKNATFASGQVRT